MNTLGQNERGVSAPLEKFIISGLNRFFILFDPASSEILFRGGALDESLVPGDGSLLSVLSRESVERLLKLSRSIRGISFVDGLQFHLSSGETVRSFGSLKQLFLGGRDVILGTFCLEKNSGLALRFRQGASFDITRNPYWVGGIDRVFFTNESFRQMFGAHSGESLHVLDCCTKESYFLLKDTMLQMLNGEDGGSESMSQIDFKGKGNRPARSWNLWMAKEFCCFKPVLRLVFMETDNWIFQLETDLYHRSLDASVGRYLTTLLGDDAFDTALHKILADAGHILGASRGFVERIQPEMNRISMTHEWHVPEVEMVRDLSSYSFETVRHFVELLEKGEMVVVHSKEETAKASGWNPDPHIANSFLFSPLFLGEKLYGFVGFGQIGFQRFWTSGEQRFVRKLAEAIGILMNRAMILDSLKKEKERAEKANQVKETFLATISHEIRNPLNAVIGLSRMLLEEGAGEGNSDHRKALEFIRENGVRLSRIMENVLELSRLKITGNELNFRKIQTDEFMGGLRNYLLGRLYGNPMVKGYVKSSEAPPSFFSDSEMLRGILMNLMDNAIKFTEKGSVTLSLRKKGRTLVFSVSDTGVGIESKFQEEIFREFYQIENLDTRKHGGAGIGLAITKRMADAIGGEIRVESVPGEGSRFSLILPLEELEK